MRKYRYIWFPLLLLIYGLGMAWKYGPMFIAAGRAWQVWLFIAIDIVICILLAIFLRKRQSF